MVRFNVLYYLLVVLIIMGAFASMAQNEYGFTVLGSVAVAFSLLFLIQLLSMLLKTGAKEITGIVELFSLVIISSILAMRIFYIWFPFVEIVFMIGCFVLMGVYLWKLYQETRSTWEMNRFFSLLVLIFHLSIVLYVASMVSVAVYPFLSEPLGIVAFFLLVAFSLTGLVKTDFLMNGEKLSAFKYVAALNNRSVVLVVIFLLFSMYMGLEKINALPKMYSNELPQAYFELVKQSEIVQDKPENGKLGHQEFKEKYDLFVNRHANH